LVIKELNHDESGDPVDEMDRVHLGWRGMSKTARLASWKVLTKDTVSIVLEMMEKMEIT